MYKLAYGDEHRTVHLPLPFDEITYRASDLDKDPFVMIQHALDHPISSPTLRELAQGKKTAVIIISDKSRLCPSHLFLPSILEQLNAGGIPDSHIQIMIALGMHRKQSVQECIQLTGESIYRRVKVDNHSPLSEHCVPLGTTTRGTPIEIHRDVVQAELRIATGNIEPHGLVGMSGGVKALVPGVASHRTIEHNHSLSQKFKPVAGNIDNPIHADLEEALQYLPLHYLFNVIVDHNRRVLDAVAGHIIQAHQIGVRRAGDIFIVPVQASYDTVIASTGGHPKDMQLYQAVKTLQNAAKITKPGGHIVLVARCEEIFGNGLFQYWVETIQDRSIMIRKLKNQFVLGPHKIEHIDKVLKNHHVHLYSDVPESIVELLGFQPVSDLQETINRLIGKEVKTAVMPYGAVTFPVTS